MTLRVTLLVDSPSKRVHGNAALAAARSHTAANRETENMSASRQPGRVNQFAQPSVSSVSTLVSALLELP